MTYGQNIEDLNKIAEVKNNISEISREMDNLNKLSSDIEHLTNDLVKRIDPILSQIVEPSEDEKEEDYGLTTHLGKNLHILSQSLEKIRYTLNSAFHRVEL